MHLLPGVRALATVVSESVSEGDALPDKTLDPITIKWIETCGLSMMDVAVMDAWLTTLKPEILLSLIIDGASEKILRQARPNYTAVACFVDGLLEEFAGMHDV